MMQIKKNRITPIRDKLNRTKAKLSIRLMMEVNPYKENTLTSNLKLITTIDPNIIPHQWFMMKILQEGPRSGQNTWQIQVNLSTVALTDMEKISL